MFKENYLHRDPDRVENMEVYYTQTDPSLAVRDLNNQGRMKFLTHSLSLFTIFFKTHTFFL